MRRRLLYGAGFFLLAILITLVVWQGSFHFGDYGPATPEQTYLYWLASTLIFILTVTLAFMLVRTAIKLYVERHANREGSRIRTKLVLGAVALSVLPITFLVVFSVEVLNRNLEKWFTRPAENIKENLVAISRAMDEEVGGKADAQARWLATLPEVRERAVPGVLEELCRQEGILSAHLVRPGKPDLPLCAPPALTGRAVEAAAPVRLADGGEATLALRARMGHDLAQHQNRIAADVAAYDRLAVRKKEVRSMYHQLLAVIALFLLFVATWIALFLAKQISVPIAALLGAAQEVRKGNLSYRVRVAAGDELASLVRAFNEMTHDLEANGRELEARRRFTEAILESIPTGVVSLAADGRIRKTNRALQEMFGVERVERAADLDDLLPSEDAAEIRYLMNRARRTGLAACQLELTTARSVRHLYATVSALEDGPGSGFVLVLEDASELLRAQKAAAWHEVARRVAHEIKNPLTPIALCAQRIARQLGRTAVPWADRERIVRECAATIDQEVESLRTLVDEFAQFSRFPTAQPTPGDLNEAVESALAVFAGRLDGVVLVKSLADDLPPVRIDREQFRRVVINLVDNAAEAMERSPVKRLTVATCAPSPDTVELVIEDTGCGISGEDKEKLFLPYFSTKNRGTGLGLAIVNRILSDHAAQIHVEDSRPSGARFVVELPALVAEEARA